MQRVICDSYNCLELKYVLKVNYTPTKNILEFLYIGYIYIFNWLFAQGSKSRIYFIHIFFFCEIIQRLRKIGKESLEHENKQ